MCTSLAVGSVCVVLLLVGGAHALGDDVLWEINVSFCSLLHFVFLSPFFVGVYFLVWLFAIQVFFTVFVDLSLLIFKNETLKTNRNLFVMVRPL